MTNTRIFNSTKSSSEPCLFTRPKEDACTGTCYGKLSLYDRPEDDETYDYIDITERLLTVRVKPRKETKKREIEKIIEPLPLGDKKCRLPMRRSLFAHVPPFIIFQNQRSGSKLPREIARHLLWWRAGNYIPPIIASTVENSGFKTVNKPTCNWCGTWCNNRAYTALKSTSEFAKVSCFPNCAELGDKIALWINFRRMKKRHGIKNFDYMPLTFVLPEERTKLRKFISMNDGIWIMKPPDSCAGSGIKLVTQLQEIPKRTPLVVQRYISRPFLLDGIKFDIRLYVLLTSIDPLRIYLYKDGLVRLATVKYINDVKQLSNRFMHLTNTSVNKVSPYFESNNDPNECKGNMWSLKCLWKYLSTTENANVPEIWSKIREIAVKTLISAEASLFDAWKKSSMTSYNFYQLFGFDVLLDRQYRPWLLEVNDYPSMVTDTPLCELIKGQLTIDYLNLVGFHVPDLLTAKDLKVLKMMYKDNIICYNEQLHTNELARKDRRKQFVYSKMVSRKEYLKSILNELTPDDVRVLIKHEDELSRTGSFERIFPTRDTWRYLGFFDKVRYYNLLLDAWEKEYGYNRSVGIEKLKKLCKKKHHLIF